MITTTLNRVRAHGMHPADYKRFSARFDENVSGDTALPFAQIVDAAGIEAALWCCRCEPTHSRVWWRFALWCARQSQHLAGDPVFVAVLDAAERFEQGSAPQEELYAAFKAASYVLPPAFAVVKTLAATSISHAVASAMPSFALSNDGHPVEMAADNSALAIAVNAANFAENAKARRPSVGKAASTAHKAARAAQTAKFLEMVGGDA